MRHLGLGLLVSVAAMGSASVALAAEYIPPPEMRGTYNSWDEPTEPLMDFEAGVRYWYSVGAQDVGLFGRRLSNNGISNLAPPNIFSQGPNMVPLH